MAAEPFTNRLAGEKSPYLLQHADNPVDWYPWGEEAFGKAKREDKPIFLSIGYATCHWCHVMAHESFEDEEVARLFNRYFVPIKVDREERPDVDQIYMTVCQSLTGRGGWPLSIFMTPEGKPFFAGTYFPKTARMGMPGFTESARANRRPLEERPGADSSGRRGDPRCAADPARLQPAAEVRLDRGYAGSRLSTSCGRSFDARLGADSARPPNFPSPHHLTFLLRLGYGAIRIPRRGRW